jgi:hypothetical protein
LYTGRGAAVSTRTKSPTIAQEPVLTQHKPCTCNKVAYDARYQQQSIAAGSALPHSPECCYCWQLYFAGCMHSLEQHSSTQASRLRTLPPTPVVEHGTAQDELQPTKLASK